MPTPDPIDLPYPEFTTRDSPLRVPSVVPGKWIYMRTWSIFLQTAAEHNGTFAGYRSCGNEIWNVYATERSAGLIATGLEPIVFADRGSFRGNAVALDHYLLGLGAEPVFEKDNEWPPNCEGIIPDAEREADRTPFRHEDWDAADAIMKKKGYSKSKAAAISNSKGKRKRKK